MPAWTKFIISTEGCVQKSAHNWLGAVNGAKIQVFKPIHHTRQSFIVIYGQITYYSRAVSSIQTRI